MENLREQKLRLLEDIGRIIMAIDDEVDWFIASFTEKDPKRKALARYMSDEKQKDLLRLTTVVYEQLK